MTRLWIEPESDSAQDAAQNAAQGADFSAEKLVAGLLARRGFSDPDRAAAFLDPARYTPASPFDLPDMDRAARRVERALHEGEHLLVWGDFDVDGQTATALLVESLRALAAQLQGAFEPATISYHIPHRQREGHGIHMGRLAALLDEAAAGGDPVQVVLTCDTGISAHEAIDYAKGRGVDVVVTDHHQLPASLPDAYAVVNPQRLPGGHPLHTLPGVGAAYKLIEALRERSGADLDTDRLLDLVALGLVADVAVLVDDARYLLQRGLDALRHTRRPGLQAMIQLAEIAPETLTETDIGFGLGPRLNALGRLDDANKAVDLLTTQDSTQAQMLANTLEGLNNRRKSETTQVEAGAEKLLAADPALLNNYAVLVLHSPHWPGGIIGIVANRLAERYNRPVVLLTSAGGDDEGGDGGATLANAADSHANGADLLRGSARSVAGVDITAALAANADLLASYGGHTMAAGLSLHADRLHDFRRGLSNAVRALRRDATDGPPALAIDAYVPLSALTLDLADRLRHIAPFGPGNPPVVLATRRLTLKQKRQMGRTGEHLRLTVTDAEPAGEDDASEGGTPEPVAPEGDTLADFLWWRADPERLPPGRFDLAYTVSSNVWKDERRVQLEVVDVRPVDEEPLSFAARAHVEVIDHRKADDPLAALRAALADDPDLCVWHEDPQPNAVPPPGNPQRRDGLHPAHTLVVWTMPPGPDELRAALERVNPARVLLFAEGAGITGADTFLRLLAARVNYALNQRGGTASLEALAASLGAQARAVETGLRYWAASGQVRVEHIDGDLVQLSAANTRTDTGANAGTAESHKAKLAALLKESAAYRRHYRQAAAESLVE